VQRHNGIADAHFDEPINFRHTAERRRRLRTAWRSVTDANAPPVAHPERRRRSFCHNLARGDHDDPIGEVLRLVHVMRRQQNGLAKPGQASDHLPRLAPGGRVKARRRLVEEQQVGIADQGDRHLQPPLLTAGKTHDPLVPLLAEADDLDHLVDGPATRVKARVHRHRLANGQIRLDAGRLEDNPDPRPQARALRCGIAAEDLHLARVTRAVALEDLDRRRLPGTVRTQQREDLADRDLEIDAAHRLNRTVRLPEPTHAHRERRTTGAAAHAFSTLDRPCTAQMRHVIAPIAGKVPRTASPGIRNNAHAGRGRTEDHGPWLWHRRSRRCHRGCDPNPDGPANREVCDEREHPGQIARTGADVRVSIIAVALRRVATPATTTLLPGDGKARAVPADQSAAHVDRVVPGLDCDAGRARATGARVAEEGDLPVAVELVEAVAELSQGNVDGPVDAFASHLGWLPHIDQHELAPRHTVGGLSWADGRFAREEHRAARLHGRCR
jgi:hypothetical protein